MSGFRIEAAASADLNFIRACWMRDVRDPADVRRAVRDLVLERAEVLVARPNDCPPDEVAGFAVLSPLALHWAGTKRAWRGLGVGTMLVQEAERRDVSIFTRFATGSQKRWLELRGWTYQPKLEMVSILQPPRESL